MNWVGGSRSRLGMKDDAKKQKDFFEKRKMQKKWKNLGLALPGSPGSSGSSSCGMDLVTLFIVNQIATKKKHKDPPEVAVMGIGRGRSRANMPLVLPMSPCSPSQLSLVEGQPQFSSQGGRKRRHVIPEGFKCQQLSPVPESAFSDNSATDYLPPVVDPFSPFSSTSSASLGQGSFPLQLNLNHQRGQMQTRFPPRCSPLPWETSGEETFTFQPFSQPRGMTDNMPWSFGPNPQTCQLQTHTAARVLFGSPQPHLTEIRQGLSLSLNTPEDQEPMLDFILNPEQQSEEDVFRGFINGDGENEDFNFGNATSKIHLIHETPVKSSAPQTVPDTQCMRMELCDYGDADFSCPGQNTGPTDGCGYSTSYACKECDLSSDSNDGEECCPPCLQLSAPSYMEQACGAVTTTVGSQRKSKQTPSQPWLLSPFRIPIPDFNVEENMGSGGQRRGSNLAQSLSPELLGGKTTSRETRDAGTQTVDAPAAKRRDVSTQCSYMAPNAPNAPGLNVNRSPVDGPVQHPATGRQTDTAEPNLHTSAAPRSQKKAKAASQSSGIIVDTHPASSSDGKLFPLTPATHFPDALSMANGRGEGDEEARDEVGRGKKDLAVGMSAENTPASRVLRPSEETLQEIADILLLLKHRKN